jgi:hypothetical protein
MADIQLKIVNEKTLKEFEDAVNALLNEGDWRITQTEMSVCDGHYFAMLIKSKEART